MVVLVIVELEVAAEAEVDAVVLAQLKSGTAGHVLDAVITAPLVDVINLSVILVKDRAAAVAVGNPSSCKTEVVNTVDRSGENAYGKNRKVKTHTHTQRQHSSDK